MKKEAKHTPGQILNDGDMNMINDGGPAFPVWELNGNGQPEMTGFGMSLRDFFAAKAMAALIAEPVSEGWTSTVARWANQVQGHTQMSGQDIVAHVAYMMADAMLRAREQQPRESVNAELLDAAKSARDALAVAIKVAWEGSTDADVAERVIIKKLDSAIARATGQES